MTDLRSPRALRWILGVTALIAVSAALPRIALHGGPAFNLHDLFDEGRVTRISVRDAGTALEIRIRGAARLADDTDTLASVTGEVSIEEKRDGHTRRLRLTPAAGTASAPAGASTGLQRDYQVDGQPHAFDADAQAWLDKTMPILVRHLASGKERLKRLMRHGGIETVLGAIEATHEGYDRRDLIAALAESGPLDTPVLARLVAAAAQPGSDYDRREALVALAEGQTLSAPLQVQWLQATATVGSDFDRREALDALAPHLLHEPAVLAAWLASVQGMGSEFDRRSTIETLLDQPELTRDQLAIALQASTAMHSDFDRRTVLEAIAPHLTGDAASLVPAYARSARGLGSGFEQRTALTTLIEEATLDHDNTLAVMDAMEHMESGFELMTTLQTLAEHLNDDPVLVDRYRRLARRLGTYERGQAEEAIDHLDHDDQRDRDDRHDRHDRDARR